MLNKTVNFADKPIAFLPVATGMKRSPSPQGLSPYPAYTWCLICVTGISLNCIFVLFGKKLMKLINCNSIVLAVGWEVL